MPDIPVEILHEIFKQSLSSPLRVHQPCEFPWYLGHVCSRWRALFFSMRSTFWSNVEIEMRIGDSWGSFDRMYEIVNFFFDCTRGAPFSFTFSMDILGDVRSMLRHFIEHSAQWEEVSVQLKTLVVFLQGTKGRLPLLKKLEIIEDRYHQPMHSESMQSIDAPRLTHVVLRDNSPLLQFNWSSLTVIHFHHTMHPERILAALREANNLVELTAERYKDTSGDISVHLPHLKCLSVSGVELLTILETPALRRLRIGFRSDNNGLDEAGITVSFLRRSEIKLSTLVLKCARATIIEEILPFAPEVNNLALLQVRRVAGVFKWLAERELQINNLSVTWQFTIDSILAEEGLSALHDMITSQHPLGDSRNPSPKEVIIQTISGGQSAAASLKSACRSRGIRFGFAEEMPTLNWGIET
ncbi:hypothetical protein F5887DRAFT_955754 [Amanita rubescens]|nr:hypothetical protein F5887DRAFT_955754 [Amanita rubescens]